jgi:hypothetical protein
MAEPQNPQQLPQAPPAPPQPTDGGMNYDEFKQALQSGAEGRDPKRPAQPPEEHPVRRFFDRLINGEHGEGFTVARAKDAGRSALRGVSNMVNESVETLGEGEAAAAHKLGLFNSEADNQEYEQKGVEQFTRDRIEGAGLKIPTDELFGKRSDDLAAGFTEDATQFMSSFALTGGIGDLSEAKGAYGLATRVARGAFVEGTAFDPHSGSMAQLMAKAPWGWVQSMGNALMEKPGDSDLVARMKRATSGAIPALVIDGLVESAHLVTARKAIAAGATGAERTAAEAQVAKSEKTLTEIQKGEYTPEGAHVVARPSEDGNWVLRTVSKFLGPSEFEKSLEKSLAEMTKFFEDPSAEMSARNAAKDAELAANAPKQAGAPLDPEALKETQPYFDTLKDPNATAEAKAEAQAKIDEFGAKGSKPYEHFERGDPMPESVRQRMFPEGAEASPKFKDRAEAEQQAESINNAINERLQAARNINGLTTEQADQLRATFKQLVNAPTEADLKGLVEGTHFNFSYYNEPDHILQMIEGVSKLWRNEIDAAQKVGGVSVDRHFEMVQELMGRIPKADQPAVLKDLLNKGGGPVPRSVVLSASDLVMREYAAKAVKLGDVLDMRPHDPIVRLEARKAASTLVELQRALASENSETGRALRFMQDRQDFAERVKAQGGLPSAPKGNPVIDPNAKPSRATFTEGPGEEIAGMKQRPVRTPLTDEDVKVVLRIAKLANGDVNALYGVGKTAQVIKEGGLLKGALEVGINSMLSGVPTAATVHIMGVLNSYYHGITKFVGSALVGSADGMREAADYMSSLEMHAVDNIKVARMAGIEGRSVINPVNTHEIIGSHLAPNAPQLAQDALDVAGNAARIPSKVLTASEEFTRVSNYRAEVYSKSLRYWRGKGLDGQGLADQVSKDLDAAFTKDGVATLPGPLARADALTMRNPLPPGTLGDALNRLSNFNFVTKMVAPFVKTSVNMMRWQFERTPGLNMFLERSRSVLTGEQGPEAAAQLWTQTAVSGWMAYYAVTQAGKDNITGRGPSNPATRPLWLEDHKPYSIKIDGHWVSYNRGDPLMQSLAIFADAHTILHEVDTQPKYQGKASDMLFATVAGMASSLGDKSFMRNSTDFFEAWAGGKSELLKKWAYGEGASMVPFSNLLRSTNNDPYLHEISSMQDELFATIPGLSDKLPAKYDLFGNPMMKSLSVFPFKDNGSAEPGVGTELMKLNKAFTPINRKSFMGLPIELDDRDKFNDGPVGLSPYERANQLLAHPKHGKPLQTQLQKLVESSDYQKSSPGSIDFPGGDRWMQAAATIQGAQHEALSQVLREYPSLRRELEIRSQEKGASIEGGQPGADKVLSKFGHK